MGPFFPPKRFKSTTPVSACFEPATNTISTMLDEITRLEDILLQIALGNSLRGSHSLFSVISKDVLQHSVAPLIETGYWELRSQEGLLTPRHIPNDDSKIADAPQAFSLPIPSIRRATKVARPLINVQTFFRAQCPYWTFPTHFHEEEETKWNIDNQFSRTTGSLRSTLRTAVIDLP